MTHRPELLAQVVVLRRRRAARDYLAVVSLKASLSARAVTATSVVT